LGAPVPGSLVVSTNNYFDKPNRLIKINPNNGQASTVAPFEQSLDIFDSTFDPERSVYYATIRLPSPAAYTVASISAFNGQVVKNVTTGPYAIENLKFDTVSRALIGVYQHDGTVVRVYPDTGKMERIGKFPVQWCVLKDSGAIDIAQRLYFSSLEDDEGYHQLLTVNIQNGTSKTTKLERGLVPLVVAKLKNDSLPVLLGFDDNSLFTINTQNGATNTFMTGLDGGPSQGGFAFVTFEGRALLFVAYVSLGDYSVVTIDLGLSPPSIVSRYPLTDDVRFLAYFRDLA